MKKEWRKIRNFILTSGFGWMIDFSIYLFLIINTNLPLLFSNFISAIVAVIFVFFVSIYKIFLKERKFVFAGLVIYIVYQIISIFFYSFFIDSTSNFLMTNGTLPIYIIPLIVKCFYTPFSLATNYIFMKLLTDKLLKPKK